MFTKSTQNMSYGRHIDNPFMSSGRSDLSFTLSLTNKDVYKGGELIIETMNSEEKFKLNAGEIIIYPSSYLHSVNEGTAIAIETASGLRLLRLAYINLL